MANSTVSTDGQPFDPSHTVDTSADAQYLRSCSLIVYGSNFEGLDLSNLRIKFNVKHSDTQTPNMADIRVYNVSDETALSMLFKLSPTASTIDSPISHDRGTVVLQAGYEGGNPGVIFRGNIKQIILGRESATDTFVDIIAGDGHTAYAFSIVSTTLAAGSDQMDQINASTTAMTPHGVTLGHVAGVPANKLPRGKVMYGNARNYLRNVGQNIGQTWSIQSEKITFIPKKSYRPGQVVVLTSKTGLIGTPQQTNEGVNLKCLLNPMIQVGGRINIADATIQDYKINLTQPNSAANIAPPLTADGTYYCLVVEHSGDTRGVDWYTTIVGIGMSISSNPLNQVQTDYGP